MEFRLHGGHRVSTHGRKVRGAGDWGEVRGGELGVCGEAGLQEDGIGCIRAMVIAP